MSACTMVRLPSLGAAPGTRAGRALGATVSNATFAGARNFCEGAGPEQAASHAVTPRANKGIRLMDGSSWEIDRQLKSVDGSPVPHYRASGRGT